MEKKETKKESTYKYPFRNLVIEGGGSKICCIAGTLSELEDRGILQNIKNFAGTSAGSIVAAALAVGYTGKEFSELLMETDFNQFLDDSYGISADLYRLYNSYGYCRGNAFLDFAKKSIEKKTYEIRGGDITFKELYNCTGNELVLIATDLTDDKVVYLSRHTTPDMQVSVGVRASMAIPFVFCPILYRGHYLCDGGIGMNYALQVFDGDFPKDMDNLYSEINPKTLGLKFMSSDEKRTNRIYPKPTPITNVFSYSTSIITHMLNRLERLSVKTGYWERSLTVPTGDIGTMDFNLTKEQKEKSKYEAQLVAVNELNYYQQNKKFPTGPGIDEDKKRCQKK